MPVPRMFFCAMPLGFLAMLCLYMSAVYLQLGAPTAMSHWCAEINHKKLEATANIPSPKLVLLGGSATLFGIKASLLESELRVPTINAATHAGMGMAYLLEHGKLFLRPGDTVILLPEFELLDYGEGNRGSWASGMYVDYILARDPGYYRRLGVTDQIEIAMMEPLKRLATGLASRFKPEEPIRYPAFDAYDPARVDRHGDMTGHTAQRRPTSSEARDGRVCAPLVAGLPDNPSGLPLIAGFCRWAASNHIRVLAGFPNMIGLPVYDNPRAVSLERHLREFFAAQGVPLVGRLADALMPAEEFFDTNYHPTEEASVQRTFRFAAQFKPWFQASVAANPSAYPPAQRSPSLRSSTE